MERKELMIGDWVYIKEYPMSQEAKKMRAEHYQRSLCEFEPIPLTKEMMKANGWDVNDSCYAWYKIDEHTMLCYYWYEKRLTKVFNIVDEWQNHSKVSDITFRARCLANVHEIQHALRLCGMIDLADNFKIE